MFSIIVEENLVVKSSDKNWFKHLNTSSKELLVVHEVPENLINKYALFHYLDFLPIQDKLTLVSYIYKNGAKTGYEVIIKMYFDNLLMNNEVRALLIFDGKENVLYVENSDDKTWSKGNYTDYEEFKQLRKDKFVVPVERINTTEVGLSLIHI